METTNLMIGDWIKVEAKRNKLFKVEKLADKKIQISNNGKYQWIDINVIEPIVLTNEMIEMNKFNPFKFDKLSEDTVVGKWWHKSDDVWVKKYVLVENRLKPTYGIGFRNKSRINNIVYVHQFQHSLRIGGLNEIADNFKVK